MNRQFCIYASNLSRIYRNEYCRPTRISDSFVGGALANGGYTFANIMAYDSAKAVSSGFIGALFAGFVGGYIMVLLRKLFDKLPSALEGLKPILLFPVCGILIMGVVMIAVNPVVGAIKYRN